MIGEHDTWNKKKIHLFKLKVPYGLAQLKLRLAPISLYDGTPCQLTDQSPDWTLETMLVIELMVWDKSKDLMAENMGFMIYMCKPSFFSFLFREKQVNVPDTCMLPFERYLKVIILDQPWTTWELNTNL